MGSDPNIRKTRLDNGLVVVTEQMAEVRSVSFGIFLRTGSRHETATANGLSHFIEHALFKGTRRRSAAQIAEESDALGGHLDAFTGKEFVGFHNKVLDEHLPRAFELIADLVTAPAFDAAELDKERNVILEEIKMVEDTPDDLVFEIFSKSFIPITRSVARFSARRRRFRVLSAIRCANITNSITGLTTLCWPQQATSPTRRWRNLPNDILAGLRLATPRPFRPRRARSRTSRCATRKTSNRRIWSSARPALRCRAMIVTSLI